MANENPLNTRLCDILVDYGIHAEAEVKQPDMSSIDVRCKIDDHVVAIEAEHGYSSAKKKEAIGDADAKIKRNVCDVAIALVYPDEYLSRRDLEDGEIQATVRTPTYQPKFGSTRWRVIKTKDFAEYVRQAPKELGAPHILAHKADTAIKTAASRFSKLEADSILAEMGEAAKGTNLEGLMTDLLTAIMFQTKLDTIRHQTIPLNDARTTESEIYSGPWPPMSVRECMSLDQIAKNFYDAHNLWLSVDYRQIFEWSCAIIDALPATPARNAALEIIAEAALDIQSSAGSQHHDLVGITFCQSVESAKNDGSMYTTIPAATMLVHLLFEGADIDWEDYQSVTSIRIVDFACGTGTLLIAAVNYILQHEQTGDKDRVAQALLEQVIYGFDINNRAIFQTATGLGMIAPGVAFRNMHLYSLVLGIDSQDDLPKLGSLELLEGLSQFSFNPRPATGTRIDSEPAPVETDTFTMAIMNPPFTRGDIRHKQLDKYSESKVRAREGELYTGLPIDQSSNANGFFVLVEKHLDKEAGRVGFVVPTVTATNPSAAPIRKYLAERFHIKYLVVSYDPKRIFFSGNTTIGEMLVVLEPKSNSEESTAVIKLATNPSTASDAVACASSIINGDVTEHKWGMVDHISASDIAKGDWSKVQFFDNELHRIATDELWNGNLGSQVLIGPLGSAIRTGATECDANAVNATPALWNHNVKHCDSMRVAPDRYVQPKPNKSHAINALRRATYLHLPERIRLTTVKNMVCLTTVPAVGSAWECAKVLDTYSLEPEDVEKAIVMILNSTPGKLGMLLVRSNHSPSYPKFSKDGLERISLPRLSSLPPPHFRTIVQ